MWKVNVASKAATAIPFSADVDLEMGPLVRFQYPVEDSLLTVRQIRDARPSPDGTRLAFTALDRLWLVDLAGCSAAGPTQPARCQPHRVTTESVGEYSPTWSPNGKTLAWVTWSEDGGDIWRLRVGEPRGRPEKLSRQAAFYEDLAYDPTGHRLVVVRGPRQQRTERENEFLGPGPQVIELVWIPATGGDTKLITPLNDYGQPHFTRDTTRVFFNDPAEGLVSVRWGWDRSARAPQGDWVQDTGR